MKLVMKINSGRSSNNINNSNSDSKDKSRSKSIIKKK